MNNNTYSVSLTSWTTVLIGLLAGFLAYNNGGDMYSLFHYFLSGIFWITIAYTVFGIIVIFAGASLKEDEITGLGLLLIILVWAGYGVEVLSARTLLPYFANANVDYSSFITALAMGGFFGLAVGFVATVVVVILSLLVVALVGGALALTSRY